MLTPVAYPNELATFHAQSTRLIQLSSFCIICRITTQEKVWPSVSYMSYLMCARNCRTRQTLDGSKATQHPGYSHKLRIH